jgi:hypothetical protein
MVIRSAENAGGAVICRLPEAGSAAPDGGMSM